MFLLSRRWPPATLLIQTNQPVWSAPRTNRWFMISAWLLWLPLMPAPGSTQQMARTGPTTRPQAMEAYGKLPLSFEANQGQTDESVKYLARGPGYSLFLTRDSAVLSLQQQESNRVLRMNLQGANAQAVVAGMDGLPGKSNYFVGSDPSRWRTNVPTYAAVKYNDVYPGIDLVYHGNQRSLEYDFLVAPGADPQTIGLVFQGVRKLSVNREGDLVVRLGGSEVIEHAPVVYQEIGGKRCSVSGRYVLRGKDRVGFSVSAYDRSRALVIDPTLVYSTFLGEMSSSSEGAIAADATGNAYVVGSTVSFSFPITPGAFQTTNHGDAVFVTKLNASGSALIYSTYLGGSGGHNASGIAVDAAGNAYVTGLTTGTDFPTTPGAFQRTYRGCSGCSNAFATKLNADGSALAYSTYLGGSGRDAGSGIAVDASGNAYVAGSSESSDFPTTPGAFQTAYAGNEDAFVSKLNATGSALLYSTYLGGGGQDVASGIALDGSANAYITGLGNAGFPTTPGAFQATGSGPFVSKLNANGSALVYSTYLGGCCYASGIAVDASGNAYVTGSTQYGEWTTTPFAFQTAFGGGVQDAFVTKLNATGSGLVYSTFLGGRGDDYGYGIAVDQWGNAYVTGGTNSTNFPNTPDAFQAGLGGSYSNAFVSKLNAAGSALLYSTYLGGSAWDQGKSIAVDALGDAFVTGWAGSANFPTTPGAFQRFNSGGNAFVSKLSFGTIPVTTANLSGHIGKNGWYLGPVTVTLSATAMGTFVSATYYSLDGGANSRDGGAYQTYAGPFAISSDGVHQLLFYSFDNAGEETPHGETIKIDQTPPEISGMPAPGCSLWPPNDKFVQVADVKASDALSGLATGAFKVSVASNEPPDPGDPDVVITPDGSGGFIVQLRADRLGTGNGRTYSIQATAIDNAGNVATTASTCIVMPQDQGK